MSNRDTTGLMTQLHSGEESFSYDERAALARVAKAESKGSIINEHYTLEDYVKRRGYYLGVHSGYHHIKSGLFPIAREDAECIFDWELEQLSVQEVRRRELDWEFETLLPLPTTKFIYTINDHHSYPETEWASDMPSPTTEIMDWTNQMDDLGYADYVARSSFDEDPASDVEYITRTPSPIQFIGTLSGGPNFTSMPTYDESVKGTKAQYKANISRKLAKQTNGEDRSSVLVSTSQEFAPHPRPLKKPSPRRRSKSGVSSPSTEAIDSAMPTPQATTQNTSENDALMQGILSALGKKTETRSAQSDAGHEEGQAEDGSQSSALALVDEGIASMSGRGIYVPIKPPPGTKRKRSPPPTDSNVVEAEASEHDGESAETIPRPPKRIKLILKNSANRQTVVEPEELRQTAPSEDDSVTKLAKPGEKKRTTTGRPKAKSVDEMKAIPEKSKQAATRQPAIDPLEAIITGKELPKTPDEAKAAAEIRYNRVLNAHDQEKKSRAGRVHKGTQDPDLMPEFFNKDLFPPPPVPLRQQPVRCVCGITHDNNVFMVQCDQCDVWQHNKCLGEARLARPKRDPHTCHVCDPWTHRKTIQGMRRKNPLAA